MKDHDEEEGGDQHQPIEGAVPAQVHEVEGDDAGLDERDKQGNPDVEVAHLKVGHLHGDEREDEQHAVNSQQQLGRNHVNVTSAADVVGILRLCHGG